MKKKEEMKAIENDLFERIERALYSEFDNETSTITIKVENGIIKEIVSDITE